MKLKIISETENGRQVFRVGDLPFSSRTEAEEFLEWLDWLMRRIEARTTAAEIWAGRRQPSSDTPSIHNIATSLAYLSFVLAGLGAVEQIHLTMIRRIAAGMESVAQRQCAEREDLASKMEQVRSAGRPPTKDDDGSAKADQEAQKTRDYLSSLEEPPKAKNSGPKG